MEDHLRYAGVSHDVQMDAVRRMVLANTELMAVLGALRPLELPDLWIASGAIYQNIWNELTGRPLWTGVKDIDVIYFDDSDISYEAEDRVIRRADAALPSPPVPVEVRNQARVHLWFPDKFGFAVPPLTCSTASLQRYASRTHAVAVQLDDDGNLAIEAPFGLNDMFSFRITPNPVYANRAAHEQKGERARSVWPEVTVEPWPLSPVIHFGTGTEEISGNPSCSSSPNLTLRL